MPWTSFWAEHNGASYDAIVFASYNDAKAGGWASSKISTNWHYICERND